MGLWLLVLALMRTVRRWLPSPKQPASHSGPPQDWVDRVRRGAPHLLEPGPLEVVPPLVWGAAPGPAAWPEHLPTAAPPPLRYPERPALVPPGERVEWGITPPARPDTAPASPPRRVRLMPGGASIALPAAAEPGPPLAFPPQPGRGHPDLDWPATAEAGAPPPVAWPADHRRRRPRALRFAGWAWRTVTGVMFPARHRHAASTPPQFDSPSPKRDAALAWRAAAGRNSADPRWPEYSPGVDAPGPHWPPATGNQPADSRWEMPQPPATPERGPWPMPGPVPATPVLPTEWPEPIADPWPALPPLPAPSAARGAVGSAHQRRLTREQRGVRWNG